MVYRLPGCDVMYSSHLAWLNTTPVLDMQLDPALEQYNGNEQAPKKFGNG